MDAAENLQPESEAMVKSVPAPAPIVVRTTRALVMQQALEEEREQRALLKKYVDEFMIEGEDYGTIPGVKKRSLFKPGAEKLTDLFRCRPEYEVMAKEVNHETGLFYYEIRCRAVNRETDTVLNEGVGSASSYESKYRYRNAGRVCPNCGKDAIIKGKAEYGGGWICFAKKGGCGAKWSDGAQEIEGQEVGKIQNPDLADVANVVLKMAKKRAQVDCALALARVSDLFTQDVEDMPGHEEVAPPPQQAQRQAPRREAPRTVDAPKAQPDETLAKKLWIRAKAKWGNNAMAHFKDAVRKAGIPDSTPSDAWTLEQVEQVELALFPPDPADTTAADDKTDIPF